MKIHEAAENYLETIYMLQKRLGHVRSIDVVNEMNYAKPTVSVVMKQFREEGYIIIDDEGHIFLTSKGLAIAENMYERHELLSKVLITIGVDEVTAYKDACKIEHDLSDKTFECIKLFYIENICDRD